MDIVIVSAEIAPFSKTGGMGDVAGSLADALVAEGHRVLTVSPRYRSVDADETEPGFSRDLWLGASTQRYHTRILARGRLTHCFIEHGVFGERNGVYGDEGGSFGDNHLRFGLLQRAALEAARLVHVDGAPLGDSPVFHVHDWPTASLPVYLDQYYRPLGWFRHSPVVLTVHNPAHQGRLPGRLFDDLDLNRRWFSPSAFEQSGDLALLRCGLIRADRLTTVSPSYAWEITTPEGGFGLDGVFRGRFAELTGILNGIDTTVWNPANDPHLAASYDRSDLSGKLACKRALQQELGLPVRDDAPLFGSVGRLDPQKGIGQLIDSIPWLVAKGAQVVVLGSAAAAHRRFEVQLRELERRYPQHVRSWIGFSEAVAHRIEAGADAFVMPSLFEPCGLNQLYSQRYGTVPIVRRTGGLADSVIDGSTGLVYDAPTGFALRGALHRALELYQTPAWTEMQLAGMAKDHSWSPVVSRYVRVYREALDSRSRLVAP